MIEVIGGRTPKCGSDFTATQEVLLVLSDGCQITQLVRHCLHCVDSKAHEMIPCPSRETVHGTKPREVLHSEYLCVGDNGPLGADGLHDRGGYNGSPQQFRVVGTNGGLHCCCNDRVSSSVVYNYGSAGDLGEDFKNRVMQALEKA